MSCDLVLLGPPGSGKGTQAELLAERLGLAYIGTGDILRDAIRRGTAARASRPSRSSKPASSSRTTWSTTWSASCSAAPTGRSGSSWTATRGRSPRPVWFDELLAELGLPLDAVILFDVHDEEIVRRITGRRVSPTGGAVYHVQDHRPKVPGCATTAARRWSSGTTTARKSVRERLRVFHETTDALIAYYRGQGLLEGRPGRRVDRVDLPRR